MHDKISLITKLFQIELKQANRLYFVLVKLPHLMYDIGCAKCIFFSKHFQFQQIFRAHFKASPNIRSKVN